MPMMPEGYYKAHARQWYLDKNRKGNFQFVMEVKIHSEAAQLDDPSGDFVNLERPIKRSLFFYMTPGTKARSLSELRSIGYPLDQPLKVQYLEPGHEESVDFSRQELLIECEHDSYEDPKSGSKKDTERWKLVQRKGGKFSREDASQFDSQMEELADDPANPL